MIPFLPLKDITASFEPELSQAVQRVVSEGWYLLGNEVKAFETEFAAFVGSNYAVGVGNGLDALTLALMAMKAQWGWNDDDEVIVPNMTFVATAEAVARARMIPVFADVDDSGVLTVETVSQVLTPRTRVVIPVHLYGFPVQMPALMDWAEKHHLKVIEDAAQAHGAQIAATRVGHFGHIAAFSFYPGKNLGALGDGGAVVTDDEELAQRVRVLANYGAARKYYHTELGLNSRLDEVQAAVLRVKLRRLDSDNENRRRIAQIYAQHIHHPRVIIPYEGDCTQSVFHIYPIRCEQRDAMQQHLRKCEVETLIHYPLTLTSQPALARWVGHTEAGTPQSNHWAATELSIPISPLLTADDALQVCEAVNSFG